LSDAISIKNLSKNYGTVQALRDVTLTVAKGEMMAVLGPSGCGKSTLLKVLAGLILTHHGEVYLDGRRIDHEPPQRRGIGFVFQNYALFERMTVADNILFGLRVRGAGKDKKKERLGELLAVTGLNGQEHKYPRQLSGGQQQRVALARALAPEPEVILLDEPLSALDIQVRRSLRHELKRIQQKTGVTTVIVTHDQEEAFMLGDRVAVMNDGRLEQVGVPLDVYHLPQNEFIATFVGENNVLQSVATQTELRVHGEIFARVSGSMQGNFRLYIRPEDLVLRRESRKKVGTGLHGVVLQTDFHGPFYSYTIILEDGRQLLARLAQPEAAALNLKPGEPVRVTGKPNLIVPCGEQPERPRTAVLA
jgi:spermidine/putrescine transport system ATP-binding protein